MAKHKITFEPVGVTIEVDPADFPLGRHGAAGSVLDIALARGISIEHACGGVGACATCHVLVLAGAENLSAPDDDELDMVERAPDSAPNSRLACRAVVCGDVTVRIPQWNRNAVSE